MWVTTQCARCSREARFQIAFSVWAKGAKKLQTNCLTGRFAIGLCQKHKRHNCMNLVTDEMRKTVEEHCFINLLLEPDWDTLELHTQLIIPQG